MVIKRNASPRLRHRDNRGKGETATGRKPRHGLARVLSKLGVCSRTQAEAMIRAGRVGVDGRIVLDPEAPTDAEQNAITVDGAAAVAANRVYIMLNKPRGYVTTSNDERGRETVFALLQDAQLPWLAPVGRLDKASEGLLLFTNDNTWAARLTDPVSHVDKTYHVQIDTLPDVDLLQRLQAGADDRGEQLRAKSVRELRRGDKNAWLEVTLDEGRNRQIRRLFAACGIDVLRLVRVSIGGLALGKLAKGEWRPLTAQEVAQAMRRHADLS